MTRTRISIPKKAVADFCARNHIKRLSVFGSAVREDFGPNSDVDILVEFQPGHVPGLGFFRMQAELSELIGRKVDLNTPAFLSPLFRDAALAESEVAYDAS